MGLENAGQRKHWALQIGYHAGTDTRYGITLGIGRRISPLPGECRYRLFFAATFDRPKPIWSSDFWRLNEPGCVRGLPIARQGIASSAWTGRDMHLAGWHWPVFWGVRRYDWRGRYAASPRN